MGTPRHAAFTLVELIAGTAILGILIAVSIPAIGHLRSSADMTSCMNHLRQIGQMVHTAAADNDGRIPNIRSDDGGGMQLVVLTSEGPAGSGEEDKDAPTLAEFVQSHGGTADLLICPAEKRRHRVSTPSYRWLSIYGNSLIGAPMIAGVIPSPASEAPLVLESGRDGIGLHTISGVPSANALMVDGSVKKLPLEGDRFPMQGSSGGFAMPLSGGLRE